MKKIILLTIALLMSFAVNAQNYKILQITEYGKCKTTDTDVAMNKAHVAGNTYYFDL